MPKRAVVLAAFAVALVGCEGGDPAEQPFRLDPLPLNRSRKSARAKMHRPADKTRRTARNETWYPQRRKISPRWTTIVIHHSATRQGGARVFDQHHKSNGWDELGYHFVIGNGTDTPDGHVEVGARWHTQKHGAHCKTPDNYYNEHGIGICLVGDFTRTRPTPKQMSSLRRLVWFLADACGIAPGRITTHRAAVGPRTECPGAHFSVTTLRRSVSAHSASANLP